MVYALEFPLLDDIKDMPDILAGKTKPPNAKMLPHKNPIAIFATKLHKKSMKYYMKVVAIQVDSKKGKIQFFSFLLLRNSICIIRWVTFVILYPLSFIVRVEKLFT